MELIKSLEHLFRAAAMLFHISKQHNFFNNKAPTSSGTTVSYVCLVVGYKF